MTFLQKYIKSYLPHHKRQARIIIRSFQFIKSIVQLIFIRKWMNYIIRKWGIFTDRFMFEDTSQTILFTDDESLFPDYPFREKLDVKRSSSRVALITTVKNEVDNVPEWMDCITKQIRLPDEIIIVDAGSTDGTYELLDTLKVHCLVPIQLIKNPGINIAKGRNQAILKATSPIIAVTDFGCRPEKSWLNKLITPFEADAKIEMVGGWYVAEDHNGQILSRRAWPSINQVYPSSFIPSSRSIAFMKSLWEKVNGYPEWLTLTGEDTYFALELRQACNRRAFVPDAIVRWIAPDNIQGYLKKIYNWSIGDGESGINGSNYLYSAKLILKAFSLFGFAGILIILGIFIKGLLIYSVALISVSCIVLIVWLHEKNTILSMSRLLTEAGSVLAQVLGFIKGARRREKIDLLRFGASRGIWFILAGVPLHDTGGGSRGAQLTLELLRQNFVVVYLHKFDSYESVNLGAQFHHPNLFNFKADEFDNENFIKKYKDLISIKSSGVLIEFPLKDFLPIIDQLRSTKTVIAYDLLDNWDTQLGSTWFELELEDKIIASSDILVATAPILTKRLEQRSGRKVNLLPNAVNHHLFNLHRSFIKPLDLPPGKFHVIYIGALWGEWFDWDLLIDVAETYIESEIVVIGDYRGQCPKSLPNLHFLGLKPQTSLPGYLAYSQIAIIPWKVNEITRATSPLKVFEYLAMHVPVVVPELPPLQHIPGVYLSKDTSQFIRNIESARNVPVPIREIESYIRLHTWQARVNQLNHLMGFGD